LAGIKRNGREESSPILDNQDLNNDDPGHNDKKCGFSLRKGGIMPLIPLQVIPFQTCAATKPAKNAVACCFGDCMKGMPKKMAILPTRIEDAAVIRIAHSFTDIHALNNKTSPMYQDANPFTRIG
jgi:hypothetical protein